MIFYVEMFCMVCLWVVKKQIEKGLDIVAFLVKYIYIWNVHQTGQRVINKKRLAGSV